MKALTEVVKMWPPSVNTFCDLTFGAPHSMAQSGLFHLLK